MRLILLLLALSPIALAGTDQLPIAVVEKMPAVPQPYVLRDWKKVARDFDAIAFDFSRTGEFLPLPWWDNSRTDHDLTGFAMPAYIGSLLQTPEKNSYDAITCLGAVLGATKAGLNKADQHGKNWVRMLNIYYSQKNGTHLYMNNPGGRTGQTFWYELLPSMLFYQIHDHYRQEPGMGDQFRAIAERWHGGCLALGASDSKAPNFDYTAFNFTTNQPVDNSRWREPDAAAGVAWLQYMAFTVTGEPKYLQAAQWAMRFLQERERNPFYECLLPYGAYVAARMNAEQGTKYPVDKLTNWVFDGSNPRQWGVIAGRWGKVPVHGLMGSVNPAALYAFTMNSYLAPAVMVPMVRYDERYARALAKWVLHVAVNSRWFYPNAWPPAEQTGWDWAAAYDKEFCIAYEGIRRQGMARQQPVGVAGPETLKPDASGRIERTWKMDIPPGLRHALVFEIVSPDEKAPRDLTVSTSATENGPWEPAFRFAEGERTRKWTAIKRDGPLWVRVQSEPSPQNKRPLRIAELFVESVLAMGPQAGGDPKVYGWGRTDLGLYGSGFVGLLAALVEPTNVEGILRIDCRATESFAAPSYPTFLFHNPHPEKRTVEVPTGDGPVDVYDTVANRTVATDVRGKCSVELAPGQAAVLVFCPSGVKLEPREGRLLCNGVVVDYATGL